MLLTVKLIWICILERTISAALTCKTRLDQLLVGLQLLYTCALNNII